MDTVLRAIAEPRRRDILRLLGSRELAAGEVARQVPAVSRPAVSQHLRVLVEAGLIEERRRGTSRLYRRRPERLLELRDFLDAMWGGALTDLKAAAEAEMEA